MVILKGFFSFLLLVGLYVLQLLIPTFAVKYALELLFNLHYGVLPIMAGMIALATVKIFILDTPNK